MHKKTLTIIAVLVLLVSVLAGMQVVKVTKANFIPPPPGTPYGTIYFNADGSFTPSNVPIKQIGNLYILTSNIADYGFNVQRDNIVIDGAGFKLIGGNWYAPQTGIILNHRINVTIQNMAITGFNVGVSISNSSNNVINANKMVNNFFGLQIVNQSNGNLIIGNSLSDTTYSGHAITISHSTNNKLRNNTVTNGERSNYWSSSNKFNLWIDYDKTSSLVDFINDIDDSNTLDGKAVYYWINQQNRVIPQTAGYVALINCSKITAQNLNLSNNGQGALLVSTTNSQLTGNSITNNSQGIVLINSSGNTITNNILTRNVYAITAYSENNTFRSNHMDDSENDPFNFEDGLINDLDLSNMVDGSPLCYWVNQQDKTVPANAGYVYLLNCSRITIQNLTFANKKQGLCLVSTADSLVINNLIENNLYGICLNASSNNRIVKNQIKNSLGNSIDMYFSKYNTISENQITFGYTGLYVANSSSNLFAKNNITDSNYTGVDFFGAANNILFGNRIENSGRCGIWLEFSKENTINANSVIGSRRCNIDTYNSQKNIFYQNNFVMTMRVNNGVRLSDQVLDMSTGTSLFNAFSLNYWNISAEGNYWSNYDGADINGDGVGDTPQIINAQNKDNYPLMHSFDISSATALMPEWAVAPNVISTILSFAEVVDALENTDVGRWSTYGYTWKNDFALDPLVTADGLIDGHLEWYAGNGSLYEAAYPNGEVKGIIQQISVDAGSDSEEYYVWCIRLVDSMRVFLDARNGGVLYTMPSRSPGALFFEVAVRVTKASQPKMNLWNVTKYEVLGNFSLPEFSTIDKTTAGHYLKRVSDGTFYDEDYPIGPVPTLGPSKKPVLRIQASNDNQEYNVWEIRTQNSTYYIDQQGTIRYVISNANIPNMEPTTSPQASSTPSPSTPVTLPAIATSALILIMTGVGVVTFLKRRKQVGN